MDFKGRIGQSILDHHEKLVINERKRVQAEAEENRRRVAAEEAEKQRKAEVEAHNEGMRHPYNVALELLHSRDEGRELPKSLFSKPRVARDGFDLLPSEEEVDGEKVRAALMLTAPYVKNKDSGEVSYKGEILISLVVVAGDVTNEYPLAKLSEPKNFNEQGMLVDCGFSRGTGKPLTGEDQEYVANALIEAAYVMQRPQAPAAV